MKLIDLHMHTFFSDGVLSPSELVYRYKLMGAEAVALTDHVDYTNMEYILKSMHKAVPKFKEYYGIDVIVGAELTYIPPADIGNMVSAAREMGAEIVVVHGETMAENVPAGTNLAAARAKCDILAHPGHLTDEVAQIAKQNNVCIELTTRNGHGNTNKEVFTVANRNKCSIILDTDAHGPDDLLDEWKIRKVLNQCDIDYSYYDIFRGNSFELVERLNRKRL
jgi:histidinol phosphatase-like PHP family hydrolase